MNISDTIVAISTPIGEAGIGIVRLSGKSSLSIAAKIFKPASKNGRGRIKPFSFKSHIINYGWIVDKDRRPKTSATNYGGSASARKIDGYAKIYGAKLDGGKNQKFSSEIIDEVLLTVMRSPRTYTREDIVEINCHSGIVPLKKILNLTIRYGARLAEPGEFTRRAFLNGRIDLAQAESICEIIRTKSEVYLNACLNRLRGVFSHKINKLSQALFEIIATFEARIDFPQEDTKSSAPRLTSTLGAIKDELSECLENTQEAKIVRDGLSVVIAGRPNVGKSSLLNALINEERCLVTPFAGTTRDVIEEQVCFDGIPLKFIDTAGLGRSSNPVEKQAVRRAQEVIASAQLVLLLFDASTQLKSRDYTFIDKFKRRKNIIAVLNKIDLPVKFDAALLAKTFGAVFKISALCGTGLNRLKKKIVNRIWQGKIGASDYQLIVNVRQERLLAEVVQALTGAISSLKTGASMEIVVEDLKAAQILLNRLCGKSTDIDEEILDAVFSQFCIGK